MCFLFIFSGVTRLPWLRWDGVPSSEVSEEDYDAPHVDVEAMKDNLKDPGIVGLLRSGVREVGSCLKNGPVI